MQSLQSLDVAHSLIQDRLRRAAQEALADQVTASAHNLVTTPAATTPSVVPAAAARARVASALRSLAVRLDPSLDCEPCVAVVSNSR